MAHETGLKNRTAWYIFFLCLTFLFSFAAALFAVPAKGTLATTEWFDAQLPKTDFGYCVGPAGDIDRDGNWDLLIGAPGPGVDLTSPGLVYLYRGGTNRTAAPLVLRGESAKQAFGTSLDGGVDLNGDGAAEFIVGAPRYGTDSLRDIGKVYIYGNIGKKDTLPKPLWVIEGKRLDGWFGYSVAVLGDIDQDSIAEYAVGALNDGKTIGGAVYVFKGGPLHPSEPILSLEAEDFGDEFGVAIAAIGDVNGDGANDFAIGAPNWHNRTGRVYIYFGGKALSPKPGFTLDGPDLRGTFGYKVIGLGDANGDGLADFAVSATRGGDRLTGTVAVFAGSKEGKFQDPIVVISGENDGDLFGIAMVGCGDLNEDGLGDMLVCAYGNDILGDRSGRCYMYNGGKRMDAVMDQYMNGPLERATFGFAAARIGDFDHNGRPVFAITARDFIGDNKAEGRVYIYRKN